MNRVLRQFRSWWQGRRGSADTGNELAPLGGDAGRRFAFVTSAYETPPDLLRELAASIAAQSEPGAQWVLVDNGTRERASRECLDELAKNPFVKLVRVEENLGILGGIRAALASADREFVMPVDSDDLVAPHAIRAFGHALAATPDAKFLFSDEDHFTDGQHVNPFYRAGWDPALALACSYVWHLCAFDRESALQLGVYSDDGANYCHDWDTLLRFVRAGHQPRHVPEVLYSWRTHAASTTNNDAVAHSGSLDSQRHVLQLHLRDLGHADRFDVRDCPLWRGAPELRVERLSVDVPTVPIVESLSELQATAATSAFAVLVRDPSVSIAEADALVELVGWLELLPEVAVVGGRLLDENGMVVSAGYFPLPKGGLAAPDAGRSGDDPGYLAMALKPRVVAAVPSGYVLVRGAWLADLGDQLAGGPERGASLVAWLSQLARSSGKAVVCTPFVTGTGLDEAAGISAEFACQGLGEFALRGVWHGAHGCS